MKKMIFTLRFGVKLYGAVRGGNFWDHKEKLNVTSPYSFFCHVGLIMSFHSNGILLLKLDTLKEYTGGCNLCMLTHMFKGLDYDLR